MCSKSATQVSEITATPLQANELTHFGLMMLYSDMELGRYWFLFWLGAIRHQAITWTNHVLSSMRPCDIHMRAIYIRNA